MSVWKWSEVQALLWAQRMIVRHVTRADADALLAFYWSLSEETKRLFLPPGPVTKESIEAHLDEVDVGSCLSLVLEHDGVIMGHAFIMGTRSASPMVAIGLRDEIIGLGYGSRMLQRLLELADASGIPVTFLSVVKSNRRAIALYRRFGFVQKGLATFRQPNDSWYMERRRPARLEPDSDQQAVQPADII